MYQKDEFDEKKKQEIQNKQIELHKFIDIYEEMPAVLQKAACWIMVNYETANELVKKKKINVEIVEELLEKAIEKSDFSSIGLLVYQRYYQEGGKLLGKSE